MAKKKSKDLSDLQFRLLKFIQNYSSDHGFSPSFREIMDEVGISSTSMVHYYLDILEES